MDSRKYHQFRGNNRSNDRAERAKAIAAGTLVSKEDARNQTDAAVQAFIAKGRRVEKCATAKPPKARKNLRSRV